MSKVLTEPPPPVPKAEFKHIKDRYGHDKSDLEILQMVDDEFCIQLDAHVKLITTSGSWAVARHYLNQRGDEASIVKRMKSVQYIGIIKDARGGPWLVASPDKSVKDRYYAVHWATLIQGAERAYINDPENKKPVCPDVRRVRPFQVQNLRDTPGLGAWSFYTVWV